MLMSASCVPKEVYTLLCPHTSFGTQQDDLRISAIERRRRQCASYIYRDRDEAAPDPSADDVEPAASSAPVAAAPPSPTLLAGAHEPPPPPAGDPSKDIGTALVSSQPAVGAMLARGHQPALQQLRPATGGRQASLREMEATPAWPVRSALDAELGEWLSDAAEDEWPSAHTARRGFRTLVYVKDMYET